MSKIVRYYEIPYVVHVFTVILPVLLISQAALGKLRASSLCPRLHCLLISQAALGKLRASSLCPRLHCLLISQAALGKLRASSLCPRLHCLLISQAALGKTRASSLLPSLALPLNKSGCALQTASKLSFALACIAFKAVFQSHIGCV